MNNFKIQQDDYDQVWPAFSSSANLIGFGCDKQSNSKKFFEDNFEICEISNDKGLLTGYFEPVLQGARRKCEKYKYPLYAKPNELVIIEDLGLFRTEYAGTRIAGTVCNGSLMPYLTRKQIETNGLDAEVLAWVCNPIDLYFMHIQGCGLIQFEDGGQLRCVYSGHNGYAYTSIGKELIRRGVMTQQEASMDSLTNWMLKHHDDGELLRWLNESYVFFAKCNEMSPVGRAGVPLQSECSVAVDPRYIPLGSLLYIVTPEFSKLVVAHDVGGAIKGPKRIDFYCGSGNDAGVKAGAMQLDCDVYLFKARNHGKVSTN